MSEKVEKEKKIQIEEIKEQSHSGQYEKLENKNKVGENWKIELPSSFFQHDQENLPYQSNPNLKTNPEKQRNLELEEKEYDLTGIEDLPKAVIDFDD